VLNIFTSIAASVTNLEFAIYLDLYGWMTEGSSRSNLAYFAVKFSISGELVREVVIGEHEGVSWK
jgi:hypothetical protein